MLDVLFALDRIVSRIVLLKVYETLDVVFLRESPGQTFPMLVCPTHKVVLTPTYSVPPGALARMYTQ
jgi:hypothetical protein